MSLTPDQHVNWILERIGKTSERECGTVSAFGLTVSRDVAASRELPLWDNSAMDGYALRSDDIAGATVEHPVRLRVAGEVAAGSECDPLITQGQTVRIMTGAPVPSAADAVVPVEQVSSEQGTGAWGNEWVEIVAPIAAGANIRRRGEDISAGTTLALRGQLLTPARLASLAASGIERVWVREKPRVVVLVTGAELRAPGEPLARGQIPESNSILLVSLLADLGIEAVAVRRNADDAVSLRAQLSDLSRESDVIITSGGIGPGTRDVTRIALEQEPAVRAVRVAMRPGQPQNVGRLQNGAFIFALPGNPVSAAVSFELFVRPALLALQGRTELHRRRLAAEATVAWRGVMGQLQVLPVSLASRDTRLTCTPVVNPRGVSHAVGGHGATDAYALVGPERGDVQAGETVTVIAVTP
ncbi:molybdopterin molybdotransferase MoeA [Leucobacter sp. W1038]|uniref:molybdopterin molybdotransferase MoeA n=1 Tax=Leucobacter sp. W1038 TaxID=3438281 RepID=UPI003D982AD9